MGVGQTSENILTTRCKKERRFVMDDADFKKHVECLMSMCTDYLMGGLKKEVFISNLKIFADKLDKENEKKSG